MGYEIDSATSHILNELIGDTHYVLCIHTTVYNALTLCYRLTNARKVSLLRLHQNLTHIRDVL